jgi:hypothetical protein
LLVSLSDLNTIFSDPLCLSFVIHQMRGAFLQRKTVEWYYGSFQWRILVLKDRRYK